LARSYHISLSLSGLTALGLAALSAAPLAAAPTRVTLSGQRAPLAAFSREAAAFPATQKLTLAISLPLRHQPELETLLTSLYDPASAEYGHYLSRDEFTARFSPTPADYAAVIAFAKSQGLSITGTHPERTLLNVTGSAAAVKAAFGVTVKNYVSPDGRLFHAPDAEPSLPASVAQKISAVIGLDNSVPYHPNIKMRPLGSAPPSADRVGSVAAPQGTGPGGGLTPKDIRTIYNLTDTTFTGKGQILAVFELDTYTPKDILRYERAFGLPVVPLENVNVDLSDPYFPKTPGAGTGEVVLDIELQAALAPKASKVLVYIAPNTDAGVVDAYQRIATDNRAKAISTSWGSTSSSTRARSSGPVEPSTFNPCSSLVPSLRGSSSTNPTGRSPSWGLRISSRTTRRPPSPPPTISASRAPFGARKVLVIRPSTTRCTRKRTPTNTASEPSRNSAITLAGSVTGLERKWNGGVVCTGCSSAIAPTITNVATSIPLTTDS